MSLRTLTRSILFATSLLAGLGQSVDALAHGIAHAHEAKHREAMDQRERHAHEHEQQGDHRHHEQHQHNEQKPKHQPTQHHAAPERASAPLQPELTHSDHQHDHLHAIVDTGIKSRADAAPFLVAQTPALALRVSVSVEQETPHAGSPAPPSERQHTASPRAPPSR